MASLREQFKAATTITDPARKQQATAALVLGIIEAIEKLEAHEHTEKPASKAPARRPR